MTDNLRHWTALEKTDPKHTKPFQRAGGFRGTATKPIWIELRLTEHFGPCGVGWGCYEPGFTLVPAGEEILVFCTLRCWYIDTGDKEGIVYGVGGDKVLVKRNDGKLVADDEAYKKAFTDALGNAFKHIGSGADVHMGRFDDSKYVAEVRQEFSYEPAPASPMLPANPEEPPEVAKSRQDYTRILNALKTSASEDMSNDIWTINKAEIAVIKKHGGDAAIAMLNQVDQKRRDALRTGVAA